MLSPSGSAFSNYFRIYKFLNLFCNSLHVLLVLVSFLVRDAVDSKINRVFKTPPSAKFDSDGIRLASPICNFFSVSRGRRRALELLWTHFSLSVTFGPSRGVSCLANISRFRLSLTTFTTHSSGTDWYVIMALETVCQHSKRAFCAERKWTQYTAPCSGLQWIW